MQSVMDEVIDTMAEDANPETLASYLLFTSQLMKWAATGNIDDMPEEYRERLQLEAKPEEERLEIGWEYKADNPELAGERIEVPVTDAH